MLNSPIANSNISVVSLGSVSINVPDNPISVDRYLSQWPGVQLLKEDAKERLPPITMKRGNYSVVQFMGDVASWDELVGDARMKRMMPAPWELLCPLVRCGLFTAPGICSGARIGEQVAFMTRPDDGKAVITLVDAHAELKRMAHLCSEYDPTSRVPDHRFGALFYLAK